MAEKKIKRIGAILKTKAGTFLFQERDQNAKRNPGRIAPFSGGLEEGEDIFECAIRELDEELELRVEKSELRDIGIFESHVVPGMFLQMFSVENVDLSGLVLHEGKSIIEMSFEEASASEKVTDFTKEVLRSL